MEGNPDFCTSACQRASQKGPRGEFRCSASASEKAGSKQKGKGAGHRSTRVLTSTKDEELLRCLKSSSFMDCIELFD